jgi:hypothetical protein
MEPTKVPHRFRESHRTIKEWGAPAGISSDEVGTIEGLMGTVNLGGHLATSIKCYWKPRPAELALLMKGQPIEVEFITPVLVPHLLTVVTEDHNDFRIEEPAYSGDNQTDDLSPTN